MNDIEIIRCKESGKYHLTIEILLSIVNDDDGVKYIESVFNKLTMWMHENNHSINYKVGLYKIFFEWIGFKDGFDSIEELYGAFKVLVDGFGGNKINENWRVYMRAKNSTNILISEMKLLLPSIRIDVMYYDEDETIFINHNYDDYQQDDVFLERVLDLIDTLYYSNGFYSVSVCYDGRV